MKKILVIILVLSTIMLFGCGSDEQTEVVSKEVVVVDRNITTNPGEVTSDGILDIETREELALALGCSLEDLDSVIQYAYIQNKVLPTTDYTGDEVYARGKTDDGEIWVTKAELKTVITPHILTKDNWSEYIGEHYFKMECIDINDVSTFEDTGDIGLLDGYYDGADDILLKFTNNVTGEEVEFDNFGWSEWVEYIDGKVSINGEAFDPSNYTCTYAKGVVFEMDLDPSYVYTDENGDEYVNVVEDEDHADSNWMVGVSAIPSHVFG